MFSGRADRNELNDHVSLLRNRLRDWTGYGGGETGAAADAGDRDAGLQKKRTGEP